VPARGVSRSRAHSVVQCRRGRLGALPNRAAGTVVRKTNESDRKFAISMRTRSALRSRRYRFRGSRQNERLARTGESQVGKIICALKLEKSVRDIGAGLRTERSDSVRRSRGIDAIRHGCSIRRSSDLPAVAAQLPRHFDWIPLHPRCGGATCDPVDGSRFRGGNGIPSGHSDCFTAPPIGRGVRAPRSQPLVKRRVTAPRR
jgi:hypothetical protein